jgi:hypothetical protein
MKYLLGVMLFLGMSSFVQASEEPRTTPEAMMREMVSPDDLRFFLNEARQASRAAAKGQGYVPSPGTAERAKAIGERIREKGFGLMELLLDEIERELVKAFPEEPNTRIVPDPKAVEGDRT